ncbi:MAG: DUF4339 domain-containing protein [Fimbriimonadaceae bacterium]|nr:DUF4339 domain-containing protein [Fimbriimonadaceae bacterium]
MQYYVKGTDGQDYGPVSIDQLKQWVTENRVHPDTQLRDYHTNEIKPARNIPTLFPNAAPTSQIPGTTYGPNLQSGQAYKYPTEESVWPFLWVIGEAILGIVFFFVLHRLGIIFAGFAMYNAVRLQSRGSKYGVFGLVFAGVCLLAVVAGWILRLSGAGL